MMTNTFEALTIPLLAEGAVFSEKKLKQRRSSAIAEAKYLFGLDGREVRGVLEDNFSLQNGGIMLKATVKLPDQSDFFYDSTSQGGSDSEQVRLLGLRDKIDAAGAQAQEHVDGFAARIADARQPLPALEIADNRLRKIALWTLKQSGKDWQGDLLGSPITISTPAIPTSAWEDDVRHISGYCGTIELDDFELRAVDDPTAAIHGEKLRSKRLMKVFFSDENIKQHFLIWLATKRTHHERLMIEVQANKRHFSEKINYYRLFSFKKS
jgi:hypothetical protein